MSKPLNTLVSAEAQKAWHAAKTLDEKVAVVSQFEELRHLFYQAWEIWNKLPDDPAPSAPVAATAPALVPDPEPEPSTITSK